MEDKIELDRIIEDINRNKNVSDITSDNVKKWDLTEVEKDLVKKYRPEKSLIIYGTLAPNRPNHSVVKHIKGKWQKAIVRGKLENKGWGAELGYFGFNPVTKEEQNDIEAFVLFSDELVENWQYLDNFEGEGYRRILARFELKDGKIGVGYIYAINDKYFLSTHLI